VALVVRHDLTRVTRERAVISRARARARGDVTRIKGGDAGEKKGGRELREYKDRMRIASRSARDFFPAGDDAMTRSAPPAD